MSRLVCQFISSSEMSVDCVNMRVDKNDNFFFEASFEISTRRTHKRILKPYELAPKLHSSTSPTLQLSGFDMPFCITSLKHQKLAGKTVLSSVTIKLNLYRRNSEFITQPTHYTMRDASISFMTQIPFQEKDYILKQWS